MLFYHVHCGCLRYYISKPVRQIQIDINVLYFIKNSDKFPVVIMLYIELIWHHSVLTKLYCKCIIKHNLKSKQCSPSILLQWDEQRAVNLTLQVGILQVTLTVKGWASVDSYGQLHIQKYNFIVYFIKYTCQHLKGAWFCIYSLLPSYKTWCFAC